MGPLALYLAIDPPDRFVTLSLWGGWSHVEAATGADLEHVERTRHEERLATWTAEHYEVVPGLAVVISPGGGPGRAFDAASAHLVIVHATAAAPIAPT